MTRAALLIVLALATAACGIPRDPEGTLERVTGGTMVVGVSDQPPWVDLSGGEPRGIEVALVEAFAETIESDIEWIQGSPEELASAMHVGELDLLIAGISSVSSLASEVTLSHPYVTTATIVGVPEGTQPPEDIAGVEVGAERGTAALGLLRKTDAEVVVIDDATSFDGALAVEDMFLDDLDLVDTGIRLQETDHVMGVPNGENAWLTELERFLLANEDLVAELLAEAQP